MKNHRFLKSFVAAAIAIVVTFASVVPSYAVGGAVASALLESIASELIRKCLTPDGVDSDEASYEQNIQYLNTIWLTSLDQRREVDYSTLSSVYAQLLMQGVPCEIQSSRGAAQGYYIRGTGNMPVYNGNGRYDIKGKYFSDGNGSIFYAQLPDNGKEPGSSTVPSTNAPTTTPSTTEAGNGANGTYIPTHSAASNDTGLLRQIAQYTHEIWFWADLINDNLRDVRRYLFMVYSNVGRFVDGMNNITKGIYRQIDLLSGYLPRLDDIYNRLFQIQSAAWASVDVENRLLYSLEDLASNISGVIVDGAVKVTSSPDPAVAEAITGIQNTLTSVISNGKVLVDNSDVVSAIQSIPAFDDTELLDRVGTIVEQIDTLSRKIDLNYFPNMYGKVTSIADTLGNTNKHLITANRKTTEIIDMLTAAVDVDTGKLLVADTGMISAVTTISNQITEQFGEYDSTYSFPNFSSSGQSVVNNKIVSGVLPSAFTSINPGTRKLLYSPSGTLTLLKSSLYAGGGTCSHVTGSPYFDSTYGVGYCLQFEFRFSSSQSTNRYETVQFPQVSFTDYSGKSLTLSAHSGSVLVRSYSRYAYVYRYYFPRWDASGNWLGWSGQNDTFQWTSSTYEPSKRVYLTPPESGTYYIYGTSDTAIPVVYASRFTGFLQSQADRVVNAVGSIPAPTDYTSQLTAVTGRMDDILAQLQSTSGSATCEHTYSQHMEQEATCILPGLMISTCSKCGDSSSEIVDPLGHDWQCTSHVDAVTDPDTGEETSSAYDIYTCSRCGDTYEDHTGTGAPDEDYSNTTISQLVVKVFSKLGTFAGKLLGSVVHLFDKAVNAVDDLASKFNDYVEQIKGFGENYPIWLSGFWSIIPAELQVALTFAVICMALGVVGKKLFFS